jgi:Holliday junction resolvase-like predicted endonuclease
MFSGYERNVPMLSPEELARNALETAGFKVHDANVLFHANCPNIDLIVYGRDNGVYVQVKSSSKPAGKGFLIVDGSPWTEEQLYQDAPIYNKRAGFLAQFVVLVDLTQDGLADFYVALPEELERAVRARGLILAGRPKRDGTRRSIGFRKELPKEDLKPWRNAWHLLGEPVRR